MCGCRSLAQVLAQNICQVGQVLHPHQLVVLYRHLVQHIVVPAPHNQLELSNKGLVRKLGCLILRFTINILSRDTTKLDLNVNSTL